MELPHAALVDFLEATKVNCGTCDEYGKTPINQLSISPMIPVVDDNFEHTLSVLKKLKVSLDPVDHKLETPFLNFFKRGFFDIAFDFLKAGANVNQIDSDSVSALRIAAVKRKKKVLIRLVKEFKANVNLADHHGRNVLHHSINECGS